MADKKKKNENIGEEVFLTFLAETRDGRYAPIEESSMEYARLSDLNDPQDMTEEEHYLYGIS